MFRDRTGAGQQLSTLLGKYRNRPDCIVLALPRGGVVLGYEVALALRLPLDVCVVRKLGVPEQPELAMGAVAIGGVTVLHDDVIDGLRISKREVEAEIAAESAELDRRERAYRGDRPMPPLAGKTVLLVDDGIATGATAEAAIEALRELSAKHVVLAVGVAASDTAARLSRKGAEIVSVIMPYDLVCIADWYENFDQVSDFEVIGLLRRAAARPPTWHSECNPVQ